MNGNWNSAYTVIDSSPNCIDVEPPLKRYCCRKHSTPALLRAAFSLDVVALNRSCNFGVYYTSTDISNPHLSVSLTSQWQGVIVAYQIGCSAKSRHKRPVCIQVCPKNTLFPPLSLTNQWTECWTTLYRVRKRFKFAKMKLLPPTPNRLITDLDRKYQVKARTDGRTLTLFALLITNSEFVSYSPLILPNSSISKIPPNLAKPQPNRFILFQLLLLLLLSVRCPREYNTEVLLLIMHWQTFRDLFMHIKTHNYERIYN